MAPQYRQMNGPQRASRKALIGQVSSLLARKRLPGRINSKPAQLGRRPRKKPGMGARYL